MNSIKHKAGNKELWGGSAEGVPEEDMGVKTEKREVAPQGQKWLEL